MTRLHWPEAGITLSVYRPAKDERPVIAAFVIEDDEAWAAFRRASDITPDWRHWNYAEWLCWVRREFDYYLDMAVTDEEARTAWDARDVYEPQEQRK